MGQRRRWCANIKTTPAEYGVFAEALSHNYVMLQIFSRMRYSNNIFICENSLFAFYHHSRSEIAHLHMSIVKIEREGQSARILPIHVKEVTNEENQPAFF